MKNIKRAVLTLLLAGNAVPLMAVVNWADSLQNLYLSVVEQLDTYRECVPTVSYDGSFSSHGLLTSAGQLSVSPYSTVRGSLAGLTDNDFSSYLQLTYTEADTNACYHYIDIDLKSARQMFDLKYARRLLANAKAVPSVVRIYSADASDGEWRLEGDKRFSYSFPMTTENVSYEDYVGVCRVALSSPRRWIRVEVRSTIGNAKAYKYPYFYLSELGVFPAEYDAATTTYGQADADVRARFETVLNSSYRLIVEEKTVSQSDIQALQTAWDSLQTALKDLDSGQIEKLVVNEIQQANIDRFVDPSFNYGGWIELYNPTGKSIKLNGCYLTDRLDSLHRYRIRDDEAPIPAHGFRVFWFDHSSSLFPRQVPFKLEAEGGTLYLISSADDKILLQQDYPPCIARTSYARTKDGGSEWGYTDAPSPGATNTQSTFTSLRMDAPVVNLPGQLFTGVLAVKVDIPQGAVLRYTTDGTTPTLQNGQTSATGDFIVSRTTVYRFRLYRSGYLPSAVATRSYIQTSNDYGAPVISIVTNPVNLYDDSLGIMVRGVNGIPGNGQTSKCNWNMDWDRPANMEYIDEQGNCVLNQEADIAMGGGWSRANNPKSIKVKADRVYEGQNFFPYLFWTDRPAMKVKTLWLRNGGNSVGNRMHDLAVQAIVASSGIDVDWQAGRPAVHYLNGEYKGVLNVREATNKEYAYQHFGYSKDEIDAFEYGSRAYHLKQGTSDALNELMKLSEHADDEATYEKISKLLDIDEFINYVAVDGYGANWDWPHNNVKAWRPRKEGGRFRFVLFDTDGAFDRSPAWRYDDNEDSVTAPLFNNLLKNPRFKKQFVDVFCLVGGSVFESTRSAVIIDSIAAREAKPLAFEGVSPWSRATKLKGNITTSWRNSMINLLQTRLSLDAGSTAQVQMAQTPDHGRLYVNGLPVPTGKYSGPLFLPAVLRAEAPVGHRFVGWQTPSSVNLFSKKSAWYYSDNGSLDGTSWQSTSTATGSSFRQGVGPFGYDGRGTVFGTSLSGAVTGETKHPTYYFRKLVTLSDAPTKEDVFTLDFNYDDGIVVYVNGTEAGRVNMPSGEVTYSTYALSNAAGNPAQGTLSLSPTLFKKGSNLIAVELHNSNGALSDIYWDASLSLSGNKGTMVSRQEELTLKSGNTYNVTAVYEPVEEGDTLSVVPVRINEVSAANTVYMNEQFKRNDWIELYNTTSEPYDVAGMYLSDNAGKPTKYQIPDDSEVNTLIPAHGFLTLWADKLESQTGLHTGFKLANEDACVVLTASDRTWSDTLKYTAHEGDESVGRYPDGANEVYRMTEPTFGQNNRMTRYSIALRDTASSGTEVKVTDVLQTDGLRIVYREEQLTIEGAVGSLSLRLYDTEGRQVLSRQLQSVNRTVDVSVSELSSGVYVARVTDTGGRHAAIKILIRKRE